MIYTALFGPYDAPQPASYGGALFTDQDISPDGWDVRQVEAPHEDPRYASRYYFDQSHLALPDAEYTIMHGANARLRVAPETLIDLLPDGVDIAACRHPRANTYEEAEACIRMRKDDKETIRAQMERYRDYGFPESFPLSACIILVRRNTPALATFERFWWHEVKHGSCRDQLSFDYARWRLDVPVFYLPHHWKHYLDLKRHKR